MSAFIEVFSNDIEIKGSHASKMKFLAGQDDQKIQISLYDENLNLQKREVKLFPTVADVFMIASIIGYIEGYKTSSDDKADTVRIFSDKARKIAPTLETLFKIMVFTDEDYKNLELRDKFKLVFDSDKQDDKKASRLLFEYFVSYARTGIDFLYEKAFEIKTIPEMLKFYQDILNNYSIKKNNL